MAIKQALVIVLAFTAVYADFVFLDDTNADSKLKCPSFSCGSANDKECISKSGKWADGDLKWTYNGCEDDKYCKTTGVAESESLKGTCTKKIDVPKVVVPKNSRYPGEACTAKSEECRSATWTPADTAESKTEAVCSEENETCNGGEVGDKCGNFNENCKVGSFCLKTDVATDSVCTELLDAAAECDTNGDYSCKAGTFCIRKKVTDTSAEQNKFVCTEAFSLENYTLLSDYERKLDDIRTTTPGVDMCLSNFVYKGRCATYDYKNTEDVEDGYLECDYNTQCEYVRTYGEDVKQTDTDKKPCVCSKYASSGKGYCPFALNNSDAQDKLDSFKEQIKADNGRDLHTMNREIYNPSEAKWSETCIEYYTSPGFKGYQSCMSEKIYEYKNEDNEVNKYSECDAYSSSTLLSLSAVLGLFFFF